MATTPADSDTNNNLTSAGKYSLRPRADRGREEAAWSPKSRKRKSLKSQPLSKYRRKTANARERSRMREINEAFEALRRVIPQVTSLSEPQSEKLTKITTLRLAMKYISALDVALTQPDLESDCDSSLLSDYTLTPPDYQHTCPAASLALAHPSHDHLLDFNLDGISDAALATHTLTASVFTDNILPSLAPLVSDPGLGNSSYISDDSQFLDFS